MIGSEAIVKSLEAEGVECVFGYPGVAIAPFYDAILATDIKTILVRQEQNAAHAASGYARVTGRVGVVAVTSGPGAENLITGIATAFADSIPLVCITGQVNSKLMGSDVFQEADVSGAVESFTKYSYIVRDVHDIPRIIKEAFYIASTGRKGPVVIDIPIDVQQDTIKNYSYPEEVKMRTYKPTVQGHAVQIKKVIKELQKARRPIICVGGGIHLSGAGEELRKFVEKHRIPVVCTMMGLSVMPTEHPLFYGMVGNNGQIYGNRAMNEADLIIMAGARVADRSISQPNLITTNKVLVHIDVDSAEIGKNTIPSIPLVGDLKSILTSFNEEEFETDCAEWVDLLNKYRTEGENRKMAGVKLALTNLSQMEGADPIAFIRTLSLAMDDDAVYVADVGQNQLWSCANAVIRRGRLLTSGGMGTMGYALPCAMGVKIAQPDRQVVSVSGDGGFQMNMNELGTMAQYGVVCKAVILRNNVLGLVRQYQHYNYKDRFSVIDIGEYPKFDKITEAYDMHYYHITDNKNMRDVIDAFLQDPVSSILEVRIDPNETV